jgi:protein-disulfide isomerase
MVKKIIEHLESCRPKEVGQHAERAFNCINEENSKEFIDVLIRKKEYLTEAQKKRVDKLIKKIEV